MASAQMPSHVSVKSEHALLYQGQESSLIRCSWNVKSCISSSFDPWVIAMRPSLVTDGQPLALLLNCISKIITEVEYSSVRGELGNIKGEEMRRCSRRLVLTSHIALILEETQCCWKQQVRCQSECCSQREQSPICFALGAPHQSGWRSPQCCHHLQEI